MSTAKNLMTADLVSIDPDDSIEEAISRMLEHGLSGLPVADASGRLLGFISEFDLIDLIWDPETNQNRVYHHMSREVHSVDEDEAIGSVAEMFRILSIRLLPVVRDERLVGIISRGDLLRHVLRARVKVAPTVPHSRFADVSLRNPAGR